MNNVCIAGYLTVVLSAAEKKIWCIAGVRAMKVFVVQI